MVLSEIKTLFRDSIQEPNEPQVDGEVQGKCDVPSLYCQQSLAMLHSHESLAPGVHMKNPTGTRAISCKNVSYVDDNDGQVSADHYTLQLSAYPQGIV